MCPAHGGRSSSPLLGPQGGTDRKERSALASWNASMRSTIAAVWSGVVRAARLVGRIPEVPPFRQGSFRSQVHHEAPAAWLGLGLGVTFGLCFLTGLLSHLVQHASLESRQLFTAGGWTAWPSRPVSLYRITQGLHVTAGIASIPLLLFKLFVVYPHLWAWPPTRSLRHAVERAGILLLVAGGLFLLVTGVQNIAYWYPWGFFFPTAHYWAAWITTGALVMHIFAKAHITRRVLLGRHPAPAPTANDTAATGGLTRRSVLAAAGGASGLLVAATVGQTIPPLSRVAVLAPRLPTVGPQGLPVNKTAQNAGVVQAARDPSWRLRIGGRVERALELSLADLQALPQREAVLPIACVEGWSASGRWRGVPLAELLAMAGAPPSAMVQVESIQQRGLYRASVLPPAHATDPLTLIALSLHGAPLDLDHGYPARLIAPNNPGVLQTKWIQTITAR